jgi:hypothetical protein
MIDFAAFHGWSNNLRLHNGIAELIITLEVGPRILSYTRGGGFNPLRIYDDQAGGSQEPSWKIRGGHRLWIAPEDRTSTYYPDNAPVAWEPLGEHSVRLTPPAERTTELQKQIDVTLGPHDTGVTLVHRIKRLGTTPITLAPWALTVMTTGGVAFMPQPELGEHPRDLLPNRKVVLWPYTDLSDPRWRFGRRYVRLHQDPARGPTKIGLADPLGWCAYLVNTVCFVKRYAWDLNAPYPDGGCNFETFSSAKMLELESLGPLTRLQPGESVEHTEHWELHDAPPALAEQSDDEIAKFFNALPPTNP